MDEKISKFVYWTPRILSIMLVLFLTIFSLDVFDGTQGFWETLLALFMHNIPSFILLIILLVSWKHELLGAIIFGVLGAISIIGFLTILITVPEGSRFNPILIITAIISAIIGTLFYIGWRKKK